MLQDKVYVGELRSELAKALKEKCSSSIEISILVAIHGDSILVVSRPNNQSGWEKQMINVDKCIH